VQSPQSSNVFQHGIIGTVHRAIPDKIIGPYLYFPFLALLLHAMYIKNNPSIAIVKAAVNTCPISEAIAGAATFNSPKTNVGQHHAPINAGTDKSIRNTKQKHPLHVKGFNSSSILFPFSSLVIAKDLRIPSASPQPPSPGTSKSTTIPSS